MAVVLGTIWKWLETIKCKIYQYYHLISSSQPRTGDSHMAYSRTLASYSSPNCWYVTDYFLDSIFFPFFSFLRFRVLTFIGETSNFYFVSCKSTYLTSKELLTLAYFDLAITRLIYSLFFSYIISVLDLPYCSKRLLWES